MFGSGRAQAATLPRHQIGIAVDTLRRAFDYYTEIGDITRAVAVAEYPFQTNAALFAGASIVATAPAYLLPLVARATGALDRLEVARVAAETVLSSTTATPLVIRLARIGLGLMAVLQGDIENAGQQYAALEPGRGTITAPGYIATDNLLVLQRRV